MDRLRAVYGVVVFLSAFLLFLVEPMAAKQLLPVLGGSSAVWVTCLVFFQAALLMGYGYAWWMARAGQMWVHAALLGAAVVVLVLPWTSGSRGAIQVSASASDHPVATIFLTLGAT